MKPLVSFVVPCYNYGRYVGECLDSILAQQGDYPFEIIVIDDASTDDTAAIVRRYGHHSNMRVLSHHHNQGHVRTISEGLQAAAGDFVARIDPDDRYRPGFLACTVPKLQAHAEVGMVYGDAALIDEDGLENQPRCDRHHGGRDFKGNELLALLKENYVCAPTVIARREAWIDALPVPADLAFSDWFFTLMIARRYELYYVAKVLADYRVHAENHHRKVTLNRSEEHSIQFLLTRIFNELEDDANLETEKQRIKYDILAAQFLQIADKYFGLNMNIDARRCYWRALRHGPRMVAGHGGLRRLAATYMGRAVYEGVKHTIRRLDIRKSVPKTETPV
jgi:glycosyltransferase involved in cell wall biosynthesis